MTLATPRSQTPTHRLSPRGFVRGLGVGTAAAAFGPSLAIARPLAPERAPAAAAHEIVRLSSNENPYGPSPAAFDAMREAFDLAWRYPDEAADALVADVAALHAVPADHVILGDGSSEILKLAAAAYTGPDRSCVTAEPTFEAIGQYALAAGARAGLADQEHTERSRRLNRETRLHVAAELGRLECPAIPFQANFVMADLGRDAGPVIAALAQRGVQVGRRFPTMPETSGSPSARAPRWRPSSKRSRP